MKLTSKTIVLDFMGETLRAGENVSYSSNLSPSNCCAIQILYILHS